MKKLASLAILLALLGYILGSVGGLARSDFSVWNWFHYWTSARYFEELGYDELYTQSWLAQTESGGPMGEVKKARDLGDYRVRALDAQGLERGEAWTDARWQSFKDDLDLLADHEIKWSHVFRDRGFNGSPAWVSIAHGLDRTVDLGSPLGHWLGRAADPLMVLAMAALLLATVGPARGGLALLVFVLLPSTYARFPGSLLQYEVFALVMVAFCLVVRKRLGAAGLCLGVATALRIFPAVFIAALLARAVVDRIDGLEDPGWRRFVGGVVLGLVLTVGLGCLNPRGPSAWPEFIDNTRTHQQHHLFGDGRVGLEHLFTIPADSTRTPRRRVRAQTLEANRPIFLASQGLVLLLLALAARRRDQADTFILACVAFFALTVASRYYWTVLALWPLLGLARRSRTLLAAGTLVGVLPIAVARWLVATDTPRLFTWLAFERTLLLGLVASCVLLLAGDLRRHGLRTWFMPGPLPE